MSQWRGRGQVAPTPEPKASGGLRVRAMHNGTCPQCRQRIVRGQTIKRSPKFSRWIHSRCPEVDPQKVSESVSA